MGRNGVNVFNHINITMARIGMELSLAVSEKLSVS